MPSPGRTSGYDLVQQAAAGALGGARGAGVGVVAVVPPTTGLTVACAVREVHQHKHIQHHPYYGGGNDHLRGGAEKR